jgi:hypothetical protein
MRLFDDDNPWVQIKDGNEYAYLLFQRHYTYRPRMIKPGKVAKNTKRFAGPGERIILISKCGKALFVWRKERYRSDDQEGVCCAVFRNESKQLSSDLILAAEHIAMSKWPGERLFTFVNVKKVKSPNPGYCYLKAGWRKCGFSSERKLLILEKYN